MTPEAVQELYQYHAARAMLLGVVYRGAFHLYVDQRKDEAILINPDNLNQNWAVGLHWAMTDWAQERAKEVDRWQRLGADGSEFGGRWYGPV